MLMKDKKNQSSQKGQAKKIPKYILAGAIILPIAVLLVIILGRTGETDGQFVLVEGGTFQMGSSDESEYERPVHAVSLDSFYISNYEVSFNEFDQFCEATGRDCISYDQSSIKDKARGNRAAIYLNWYDTIEYCNWKSEEDGLQPCYAIDKGQKDPRNTCTYDPIQWIVNCDFEASGYRLPTEAEWEYAARGGQKSKNDRFSGTSDLDKLGEYAYFHLNSDGRHHDVNEPGRKANELGLYNMSGNASEWCWDWFAPQYDADGQTNPTGAASGQWRVKRGGSWGSSYEDLSVSYRGFGVPGLNMDNGAGFRVVKTKK